MVLVCSLISLLLLIPFAAASDSASDSVEDYIDLPLADLLSMEVTSVSKKKQRLADAAAAIFVISQEDIRRSGVTSIPEALRMAPGVQVARVDANKWAITTRGFNGQFANKLLVMIDGRSVYTSSFSGVYWDAQDTLLEDIDRIEVIRGPGATLWGANAVNGVINIITKYASDTQGGLLALGGGEGEKGFASLRYGADLSDNSQGRLYAKTFKRDSFVRKVDGSDAGDDWESVRTGFRIDANPSLQNNWTFQGDLYDTDANQSIGSLWLDPSTIDPASINPATPPGTVIPAMATGVSGTIDSTGWNLLSRWDHVINDQSSTTLQVYYDHTEREETILKQDHNTFDIDFQHNLNLAEKHELIWGLGYRHISDHFNNTITVSLLPDHRHFDLVSAFIQDQIELAPDSFYLTIGSKFEHNDYTGSEIQPSIRGLWKLDETSSLWASVSRAVRTPSRVEAEGMITTFSGVITTGNPVVPVVPTSATITGSNHIESEVMLAYELGYRIQPVEKLSLDLAIFYNDYDNLQTFESINLTEIKFGNKMSGHATGLEVALDWHPTLWWRVQASYSTIKLSLELDADSMDQAIAVPVGEGSSPEHQLSLRSGMDLGESWQLDFWIYFVDELPVSSVTALNNNIGIDSYTILNTRLGWRWNKKLEFSLVALNLLDDKHAEFTGEYSNGVLEVERTVYGKINWEF